MKTKNFNHKEHREHKAPKAFGVLCVLCVLCGYSIPVRAQTFGGAPTITGTTNNFVHNYFNQAITNTGCFTVPLESLTVSGINTTSEVFYVNFGFAIVSPNLTNYFWLTSISNTFVISGTNVSGTGTWSTNIPQQSLCYSIVPAVQCLCTNPIGGTNQINQVNLVP